MTVTYIYDRLPDGKRIKRRKPGDPGFIPMTGGITTFVYDTPRSLTNVAAPGGQTKSASAHPSPQPPGETPGTETGDRTDAPG